MQPLPRGPQPTRIAGKAVRVIPVRGEVLNLAVAEVRGDSLYGMRLDSAGDLFVVVPRSEVRRLETKKADYTPVLFGLVVLALPRLFIR